MPKMQIELSTRSDQIAYEWKSIRGFKTKSEAVNDLIERTDIVKLEKTLK